MELKITKEKVLGAAAKCSTAKAILETLFPEAFEDGSIHTEHTQVFRHKNGDSLIQTTVFKDGKYRNLLSLSDNYAFKVVLGPSGVSKYLEVTKI